MSRLIWINGSPSFGINIAERCQPSEGVVLIYHVNSSTIYLAAECPYPPAQCRNVAIADLAGALMVVGKSAISVVCIPEPQGYLVILKGGEQRYYVRIPDTTLSAAQSLARAFAGQIVPDPDGHIAAIAGGYFADENSVD